MIHENEELYESLKADCSKCFGLCCVALYFSASEGFPRDKDQGKPCVNLQSDFKCSVHRNLKEKGLKGCTAYDCFGAGQKVAQVTYNGQDWKANSQIAKQMFDVFLIMRELQEMLWYLTESFRIQEKPDIKEEISDIINETLDITRLEAESLIKLDLPRHRSKVNELILKTSEVFRRKAVGEKNTALKHNKRIAGRLNLMGADLRRWDLKGKDLRGTFLIAANLKGVDLSYADLIGVDLRDADIRGANLTQSIFITQSQINSAKGDSTTRLPVSLNYPSHWEK